MIVCAGEIEQFSFAKPIGIGITQAAINTTLLALKHNPQWMLFVGTAGSYGEANIFDIFYSTVAKNIEISLLESKSYSPIDNQVSSIFPHIVSRETIASAIVNSSNYITTDKSLWNGFKDHSCDIENMEFYGFLSSAKALNIKAFGLFCVTNFCDSNAHAEFINNHNKAKNILINTINKNFEAYL